MIAGQGTVGLEVAADCAAAGVTPDAVLVPTSGGGLAAGIGLAIRDGSEATDIVLVEPEGFDDYRRSLAAGLIVANPRVAGSVCDALLVNYGAFDMTARASHDRYDGDAYMLTVPEMADFWDNYLRAPTDEHDPLARPLLADLTGMPPTFLCIAECDILADENREMAERLRAAGVAVETQVYRGATHSFLEAVRIAPLADRALADAASWLRTTLKLPSSGR